MRTLSLCLVALAAVGCSAVEVVNMSDTTVVVQVTVPDRSGSVTRSIPAREASLFTSEHGGTYSVGTLPDRNYLELLQRLRSEISGRLFLEGASLSAADATRLQLQIIDIDREIKQEQSNSRGGFCRGRLPDWESARAVIAFDEAARRYRVDCF